MTNDQTKSLGQIAYEAYCGHVNWKSDCGYRLPYWDAVADPVRLAWERAAEVVAEAVAEERDAHRPRHLIAVIDDDGDEALYVGGELWPIDGSTIYAVDLVEASGEQPVELSQVALSGTVAEWPARFEYLLESFRMRTKGE